MRKKIVHNNCIEKKALLDVVSKSKGIDTNEYNYCKKILHIFTIRSSALRRKNIFIGIKAFIKSIGMGSLYESVLMDIVTIIK